MSFKHLTPEQRKAAQEKSSATRRAKKAKREAELNDTLKRRTSILDDVGWNDPPEIVYGEIAESEAVNAGMDTNDPFSLFLSGLAPSTRETVGLDELHGIFTANVAKAEAEKKAVAKKVAAEDALQVARMAAGLIPLATQAEMETKRRNSELLRWTCELPPVGDQGEIPDDGLRIDGALIRHGSVHIVTRAQYDSRAEMIYRAGEHELTFKGQNRRQRQWLLGRALGSVARHIPLNEDGSFA